MENPSLNQFIKKKDKGSGEYENLYLEGVELLQKLSGSIWTDYNEHDPGITILENMAYALTELNYKVNLPINDLLATAKGDSLSNGDNGFFIPSEILTTNPVTVDDYRKIMIDRIDNVKNVWLTSLNESDRQLSNLPDSNNIRGLYNIFVELYNYDKDLRQRKKEYKRVVSEIEKLFHAHRNLCEDLYEVKIYHSFDLKLALTITIDGEVDGEDIMARIFYEINDYLGKEVNFYSLWQLQERGVPVDQIFDGPKLENGFILPSDLGPKMYRIELSQIMKRIVSIKGVISVNLLQLQYPDLNSKTPDTFLQLNSDHLLVPQGYTPQLLFPDDNKSLIVENDGVVFHPDLESVKKNLGFYQALGYGNFKSVSRSANIVEIPKGNQLPVDDYYELRKQFPEVYGIGEFGLNNNLSPLRYAQANQLKAFLLPLDQIMANFLSQTTHVFQLYNVHDKLKQSYFYQLLNDMPNLVPLIKSDASSSDEEAIDQWEKTLGELNKKYDRDALNRLNEAVDSLIDRFSESFATYALRKINTNCYGSVLTHDHFDLKLLNWKRKLVSEYARVSYNRAKGYNYLKLDDDDSNLNVVEDGNQLIPGLVHKTAILMGIKNVALRSLVETVTNSRIKFYRESHHTEIIEERMKVVFSEEDNTVILVDEVVIIDEHVENFYDAWFFTGNSETLLDEVLKYGILEENYSIKTPSSNHQKYYILFKGAQGTQRLIHITKSEESARKAIAGLIHYLTIINEEGEGMFLIEHILLAPPYQGNYYGFEFLLSGTNRIGFKQEKLQSLHARNNSASAFFADDFSIEKQLKVVQVKDGYSLVFEDSGGDFIAVSDSTYENSDEAQQEVDQIINIGQSAGIAQIEKSLTYYAWYNKRKVDEAFFSFVMSIILPAWPVRFQDKNFRTKMENTIYENAPIHLGIQYLWLELEQMAQFEQFFFKWGLRRSTIASVEQLDDACDLIGMIEELAGKTNLWLTKNIS